VNEAELLALLRSHRFAVGSTASTSLAPQAAIIGIAVTDQLELVFDTLASSRKAENLRTNPRMAMVIGGWSESDPRTVQYEGVADLPTGVELDRVKQLYFAVFPDGPTRLSWPGITYVRVKPVWIRVSDFTSEPPNIIERTFSNQ
jgi:pyridoxine/pyridoxamine 5'-phosphate oxidase